MKFGISKAQTRIYPVLLVVLVDCIGAGIILPIGPRILTDVTGQALGATSVVYSWLVASYSLALFLFAPMMGRLSDRFGRVPVLIASLLGLTLDYIVFATARDVWLLFAARIMAGACGASISVAAAYIADCTPSHRRASGFGLMGAAGGIGIILGPVLGGSLSGTDPQFPFVVAAMLAILNFILVITFVSESLPHASRRSFRFLDVNPASSLLRFRKFSVLRQLALTLFFFEVSNLILPTIWVIFSVEHLGWSPAEVGLSFSIMGVMQIAVQGGLTHPFVKRLGEYGVLLLGGCLIMGGFLLAGCGRTSLQVSLALFVMTLGWIAGPATNSLISKQVQDSEQGELQGAMRSLESLGMMLGPLIAGWTYATFSEGKNPLLPGAPMLLGGALVFIALLCASPAIARALSERKSFVIVPDQ